MDALILVGGRGTRLHGAVSQCPKPLAEVAGRPFLEWMILFLRKQEVGRAILCTGYKGEMIESHFSDGRTWGLDITYSRETTPLGTGGAIRQALDRVRSDRVLALNGDSFCHFDLGRLDHVHAQYDAIASMWVVSVDDCQRSGFVEMGPDGDVRGFHEKPSLKNAGLINAGVYLLDVARMRKVIPQGRAVSLEKEVFPLLVGRGLYAVTGPGPFIDIGTPESYEEAQRMDWPTLVGYSKAKKHG